ncbi:putative dna-directed rna polymerase iii 25 kd polypeptide [Diplodia seriata]|uniref:DNA-directed RNA polymerase subunit n=1 Tax=Diplodia seriata TaxID=420778 RepID=A0A0G2HCB8_9PEZI|nr:putative dna-directed rna polymerase iii 25 kd polypeptide [Diplodia seriata]
MFLTTTISDLIQIKPEEFEKSSIQAIKDAIHAKYANKVIQEVGLCICLRDILKSSEGLIGHVALEFFDDIFVPGPVNLFEGVK